METDEVFKGASETHIVQNRAKLNINRDWAPVLKLILLHSVDMNNELITVNADKAKKPSQIQLT